MRRALICLQELNKSSLRVPGNFLVRNPSGRHIENLQLPKLQIPPFTTTRNIHVSCSNCKETTVEEIDGGEGNPGAPKLSEPPRDPAKDRREVVPLDVSMRYMESNAYKETYGETPVWVLYRRNFKGQFAPNQTRKACIRNGMIATGNPCPLCRDEYLVLDYRNVKLLKQFVSPFNGEILHFNKTGVCRVKQMDLLIEMEKAKDYGTITFDVPIRHYDYSEYYKGHA